MSSYLQKRKAALYPLQEKQKLIEEETVKLKQKRELREVELRQAESKVAEIAIKLTEANGQLAGLTTALDALADESLRSLANHLTYLQDAAAVVDGYFLIVKGLEFKIANQEQVIKKIFEDQKQAREQMSKEESRLAVIKKDLGIYRDRLEAKIKEHNLQDQIKINIPQINI